MDRERLERIRDNDLVREQNLRGLQLSKLYLDVLDEKQIDTVGALATSLLTVRRNSPARLVRCHRTVTAPVNSRSICTAF